MVLSDIGYRQFYGVAEAALSGGGASNITGGFEVSVEFGVALDTDVEVVFDADVAAGRDGAFSTKE